MELYLFVLWINCGGVVVDDDDDDDGNRFIKVLGRNKKASFRQARKKIRDTKKIDSTVQTQ
jgi:hypothetical protein